MAPTIRPVRAGEYGTVGELTIRAYQTVDTDLGDYEGELRGVADRARSAEVLVAEVEGQVAGTVTYVAGPGSYAEGDDPQAAWIRMLAVDPALRGRGIGEALVRSCLERARTDGRRRVVLHTTDLMPTAQRLYARLGFRRTPRLDWEPEPGFWLRGYVYDLPTDAGSMAKEPK